MEATEVRIVLVTTPDAANAAELTRTLVEERLAACGNIVPLVTSIFRWQDEVQQESESLLLLKTSVDRFAALRDRVLELHPYDVPEVLSLPVDAGSGDYVNWLGDCMAPAGD